MTDQPTPAPLPTCGECYEPEIEDCGGCLALNGLHQRHRANRQVGNYVEGEDLCPAYHPFVPLAAVEPAPPAEREGEERWATARRVASDDHPKDCPCIRDHLENAFLLGMVEGEERATPSPAPSSAEVEAARKALRITGAMYQWTRPDSEQSRLWLEAESAFERAIRKEYE